MQNAKRKTQNNSVQLKTNPPKAGYRSFAFFALRFTFKEGFTLLETIIALSLILAAMVGPVTVVTRSIASFPSAKNRLAALNLTQEGIELVRLVRENNILCDDLNGNPNWPWDRHPSGNGSLNGTWEADATQIGGPTNTVMCGSTPIPMPYLSPVDPNQDPEARGQKLNRDPDTGLIGYSGTEQMIFKRMITVKSPPDNDVRDQDINKNEQMDIISKVWWYERGNYKEVELLERLYNWR